MTRMRMHGPLLLILAAVAACSGATTVGSKLKAELVPEPITRLIIDYTPAATQQSADDARFNGDALRRAVGDGLAARGLADLANAAVIRVAAIEVDEFDVRATSNVVLMGRVASAGVLGATVRIRDGGGTQLRQFHVRAELSLKVAHSGTNRNTLAELYDGFTGLIVAELAGKAR